MGRITPGPRAPESCGLVHLCASPALWCLPPPPVQLTDLLLLVVAVTGQAGCGCSSSLWRLDEEMPWLLNALVCSYMVVWSHLLVSMAIPDWLVGSRE